jgi:hypothetical protein
MHNKHIREMRQGDAKQLYKELLEEGLFAWRATLGFRIDAVLHIWTQLTGVGQFTNKGVTLCGKTMLSTSKDDWENIVTKRHCPTCASKLELLKRQAGVERKRTDAN